MECSGSATVRRRLGVVVVAVALLALPATAAAGERTRAERPLEAALVDLAGARVKLAAYHGAPVLLELWASWCLPCHAQAAALEAAAGELAAGGVTVLAVNVGEDRDTAAAHLERQPSRFPVLLDRNQQVAAKLGIAELPALVALRPDGTVAGQHSGLLEGEALRAWLRAVVPAPGGDAAAPPAPPGS